MKRDWSKLFYGYTMISLIASILFLSLLFMFPDFFMNHGLYTRSTSDYCLMLVQCILGVFALHLPNIIKRRLKIEPPGFMLIMFTVFMYCAIFLGEVRSFYYKIPSWDTILHMFSGGMLGALGFSIISILNDSEEITISLSSAFVSFFAFCFALTLGTVWEIYEFLFDGFLGLNMQKFMLEDGTILLGRVALMDTMKDLIVDAMGAFVMTLIGYISLKYDKGWVESWLLIIHREKRYGKK